MDVIETAYKALEPIRERGIQVQEGWYDEHYKNLHITLWPLTETPEASSDDGLEVETAGLQVTIFSTTEQESLRQEIKQLLAGAGAAYQGTDQQQTRIEAGVYIRPLRFLFYEERSQ